MFIRYRTSYDRLRTPLPRSGSSRHVIQLVPGLERCAFGGHFIIVHVGEVLLVVHRVKAQRNVSFRIVGGGHVPVLSPTDDFPAYEHAASKINVDWREA
jgi:hypothetical protein